MKTYMGIPGAMPTVTVTDGGGSIALAHGFVGWGQGNPFTNPTMLGILRHHLGNDVLASRLHLRIAGRTLAGFKADQPWTLDEAQLNVAIAEVQTNDDLVAAERAKVNREPAPVEREGGRGPGGGSFSEIQSKG